MDRYQEMILEQTLALKLPLNKDGYIQDELLLIEQFKAEYIAHDFDLLEEINADRLLVLTRGNNILIARSDAEKWSKAYWHIIYDRDKSKEALRKIRLSKQKTKQ